MTEGLKIYDLEGNFLGMQKRNIFYDEIRKEFAKKGKITRMVRTIRLFLLNSKGGIYLQKRSKKKKENPGLYDKTVGGHVAEDDSEEATVVKESAEELGFPTSILPAQEFESSIRNTNLKIVGVFKQIDHIKGFISKRVSQNGNSFLQPQITSIYVGYYDGPIQFIDGESSGIEVFTLDELKQELKNHPKKFTEDVHFMVKKYEEYLKPIKK